MTKRMYNEKQARQAYERAIAKAKAKPTPASLRLSGNTAKSYRPAHGGYPNA